MNYESETLRECAAAVRGADNLDLGGSTPPPAIEAAGMIAKRCGRCGNTRVSYALYSGSTPEPAIGTAGPKVSRGDGFPHNRTAQPVGSHGAKARRTDRPAVPLFGRDGIRWVQSTALGRRFEPCQVHLFTGSENKRGIVFIPADSFTVW